MPLNQMQQELHACAMRSLTAAAVLLQARLTQGMPPHGALEDHRTQLMCDLLETLNRVQPGLGDVLLSAMYPFTHGLYADAGADGASKCADVDAFGQGRLPL